MTGDGGQRGAPPEEGGRTRRWEEMRDPARPDQLALEGWYDPAPFSHYIGMEIVEIADGMAILSMPFKVKLAQGAGFMHGGAQASLADTAIAMAIKSILPEGAHFLTRELTCRYLAPVKQGTITATARVVSRRGKHLETEAILRDETGREVAKVTAPFLILHEGEE